MMCPTNTTLTLLGLVILSLVLTSLAQPVDLEDTGRPKRNPWELNNPDVMVRKVILSTASLLLPMYKGQPIIFDNTLLPHLQNEERLSPFLQYLSPFSISWPMASGWQLAW